MLGLSYTPFIYTSSGGTPEVVPDKSLGETWGDRAIKTQGKVPGCRLYCRAKIRTGIHWLATLHNRTFTTVLWSPVACKVNASGDHTKWRPYGYAWTEVFWIVQLFKKDPRLKLAMIMNALLSSCSVAIQGCAAWKMGESAPGKGEKQTARNCRNGEVFPVFIQRAFILTVDEGKHGTSSGGYPRVVLDGLARLSRRVCAVFVLVLCPGSVLPQSRERL